MKQALRLITIGLTVFFSMQGLVEAQITLTEKDYPYQAGADSISFDESGASIQLPKGGANMKWDYSTLKQTRSRIEKVIDASGQSKIKDATHKHSVSYTVQAFRFRAMDFDKLDENGYSSAGRIQFDTTHSLLMVTGNAADEMHFPYYEQNFTHPRSRMKFPYTYEDGWEEMDIQITRFDLTVAAFALNKTPGEIVRRRYQKRKVIGYGELTIPDGFGGKSQPIHVLLVNIKDSIIDSVFLAGQPAPAALLSAFNFTQGNTWHYEAYAFEMRGLGRQPLGFIVDDFGDVTYAYYRTRAARLVVDVNEPIDAQGISVYPIQARSGETIHISGSLEPLSSVRLISMDGSVHTLQGTTANSLQVPNLTPGLYMLQANDAEGRMQFTEKIIVVR